MRVCIEVAREFAENGLIVPNIQNLKITFPHLVWFHFFVQRVQ